MSKFDYDDDTEDLDLDPRPVHRGRPMSINTAYLVLSIGALAIVILTIAMFGWLERSGR